MVSLLFCFYASFSPSFPLLRSGRIGLDSGQEGARMTAINNTRNARRMAGNFVKNNSELKGKTTSYVPSSTVSSVVIREEVKSRNERT